jgi:hypothetical protein
MAKWRKINEDWMAKKIKNTIPSLDLGVVTTKTEGLPEFSEEPEYPPVFDSSKEGLKRYHRDQWIKTLREYPTVEEKQFWMNARRYYGFKTFMLNPLFEPYGAFDFMRYCTRTQFITGLPQQFYDEELNPVVQKHMPSVKSRLLAGIKQTLAASLLDPVIDEFDAESQRSNALIRAIVESLVQDLSVTEECSHLKEAAVSSNGSLPCQSFN